MAIQEFVQGLAERLSHSAHVKSVFGEPISIPGKTVVPVAAVRYGFGAGGGGEQAGGGGGGVNARPVGFLEITEQSTRFVHFNDMREILAVAALGIGLGLWLGRRR